MNLTHRPRHEIGLINTEQVSFTIFVFFPDNNNNNDDDDDDDDDDIIVSGQKLYMEFGSNKETNFIFKACLDVRIMRTIFANGPHYVTTVGRSGLFQSLLNKRENHNLYPMLLWINVGQAVRTSRNGTFTILGE